MTSYGVHWNILVIEDDPGDILLIEEMLQREGTSFKLESCARLEQGLQRLQKDHFHVLLLDLGLPDSQGLETLRNTLGAFPAVPTIVLTGMDDEALGVQSVAEGAQDYLMKGRTDGGLLVRSIRYAIARKQAEEGQRKALEELNASQQQLLDAEKMAALATLTAGIAHELNNPLMGILNYVQYCLKHTDNKDRRFEVLQGAEREARRSVRIIQDLLALSRPDELSEEMVQSLDLGAIIDQAVRLLHYRIEKEGVRVEWDVDDALPRISARAGAMLQVMMNLIGNALDAMAHGPDKVLSIRVKTDGASVEATIGDSGAGIPGHVVKRIFDPFFTTKPVGKGTGLGLSVSRGIVEAHGGRLTCESEEVKGAVFVVRLPVGETKEMKKEE